jgi:hypothetical protein
MRKILAQAPATYTLLTGKIKHFAIMWYSGATLELVAIKLAVIDRPSTAFLAAAVSNLQDN